jgi:hypothetical protein
LLGKVAARAATCNHFMPVHNTEIASIFDHLADLLEIEGANPFCVRAYRNGARTIVDLPHSIADMLAKGEDLAELPGIGQDLAAKTAEFAETKARLRDRANRASHAPRHRRSCLPAGQGHGREGRDGDRCAPERWPSLHEVRRRPGSAWLARSGRRPEHAVLAGASQDPQTPLKTRHEAP